MNGITRPNVRTASGAGRKQVRWPLIALPLLIAPQPGWAGGLSLARRVPLRRSIITTPLPSTPRRPLRALLLDVDGTLLDSNDAHARAWVEALERHGRPTPYDAVRSAIGKGGDKLLAELVGIDDGSREGTSINDTRRDLFVGKLLPSLQPTCGARALLEHAAATGLRLVVATSASGPELEGLLRQAGVADLIDASASSSDAERSKPDPDIVQAALVKAGVAPDEAVMLGDTPHDVDAARSAGVATIALRCGGWWDDNALNGAAAIYDDPAELLASWRSSPLRYSGR